MQQIIIGREFSKVVTQLIKEAKQSVKILAYDWRWYPTDIGSSIQKFNLEILHAVNRGVDINVLLNGDGVFDDYVRKNIKIKRVHTKRIMHIKLIIIDEKTLVIGSHNLTKNAFELNHEMSVVLDDPVALSHCNRFFDDLCHL